ncbi:MAG: hypothetical protein DRJ28_02125 [Actinobacteria bacterium]|nr:MAG: hypothetical protein DRJ28_02125 [Actinomycetota bacterium]
MADSLFVRFRRFLRRPARLFMFLVASSQSLLIRAGCFGTLLLPKLWLVVRIVVVTTESAVMTHGFFLPLPSNHPPSRLDCEGRE